jgi:hypothetical protein
LTQRHGSEAAIEEEQSARGDAAQLVNMKYISPIEMINREKKERERKERKMTFVTEGRWQCPRSSAS